jgi:hypothetical protein
MDATLIAVHPLNAQPPGAPPKTTDVIVMMTLKSGVPREELAKVRQWFQRSDGQGVAFILPATTVADAQTIMQSLPLTEI